MCVATYVVWVAYRMRKEEETEKVQTGIPVVLLNLSIIKTDTSFSTCGSYGLILLLC